MANKRDINLEEYGLSRYVFRELHYFCLQDPEKKKKLAGGDGAALADIKLIEEAARQAAPDIYDFILQAVTNGWSYVNLCMTSGLPCGKNYFDKQRRKFYYLLQEKGVA